MKADRLSNDADSRLQESLRRVKSVTDDLARLRHDADVTKDQISDLTNRAADVREMALKALEDAKKLAAEVKGHQPGISDSVTQKIAEIEENAENIDTGGRPFTVGVKCGRLIREDIF